MELRKMLMDAATPAGGDGVTFSASVVSENLTKIITDVSEIYGALTTLTTHVDEAVGSSDEAVLRGAVSGIKEDWGNFQTEYRNFQTQLEAVRSALVTAGGTYEGFNSGLTAAMQKAAANGGGADAGGLNGAKASANAYYTMN